MVAITKPVLPKHKESLSPKVEQFVNDVSQSPLQQIPKKLAAFPSRWLFPRGDLYHWIPLLNRFDHTLERFCHIYKLRQGPQTIDFTCELLDEDPPSPTSHKEAGFSSDGDREVVEAILNFSRLLLESCGNRSIYASSPYLSDLLNSTSLSLLAATLSIGTELAKRFQASYKRMPSQTKHANQALLQNHYNIDLDRVQQLSLPFAHTTVSTEAAVPATPVTPSAKGKDKAYFSGTASTSNKTSISTHYANDLVSLARGQLSAGESPSSSSTPMNWNDWAEVRLTYYETQSGSAQEASAKALQPASSAASQPPPTPTPARRSSNLSQQSTPRVNRAPVSEEPITPISRSATFQVDDSQGSSTMKVLEITNAQIKSSSTHELLKENLPRIPKEVHYELLSKLRVAVAFASSLEARQQILKVRILAVTNLCYIHAEPQLTEKVLKQDADEPRRLQIIYQLAELIHPPSKGQIAIPRPLQTIALYGLEALAQLPSKHTDISLALNTSVNHGVLLYIVRTAVAEMASDDDQDPDGVNDKRTEGDEWRTAVFSLLSLVSQLPHAGSQLVSAGLIPVLVEVLKLRTNIAERSYVKVIAYLDIQMFQVKETFQEFSAADGLNALSDLVAYEVETSLKSLTDGRGASSSLERSANVDYDMHYLKQSTIRWVFKLIHHMMTGIGGNGGSFERLLRTLIDSSKFLDSLRQIMEKAEIFGSAVWTLAVVILNDFINNEPTSFSIIAEAGLTRAFLETVSGNKIPLPEEKKNVEETPSSPNELGESPDSDDESTVSALPDNAPHPPTQEMLAQHRDGPLARGIIASSEALNTIPQVFGAICLNSAGMRMFQASGALKTFFEIFESPEHVEVMDNDPNLPMNLGATFDELIRHHPPLKDAVTHATIDMVARVSYLCKSKLFSDRDGAQLFLTGPDGKAIASNTVDDPEATNNGKGKARADSDVEMGGVGPVQTSNETHSTEKPPKANAQAYINAVSAYLTTVFSNTTLRNGFMEKGGIEIILDLAEAPSLPANFSDERPTNRDTLHKVIGQLAEQKPHLLMPSILKRSQAAADALAPLIDHGKATSYFSRYLSSASTVESFDPATIEKDSKVLKSMVNLQSLLTALRQCFAPSMYNHRNTAAAFNQLYLSDYWIKLVNSLGSVLGASIAEDFNLQMSVSHKIKRSCRPKDHYGFSHETALALDAFDPSGESSDATTTEASAEVLTLSKTEKESAQYKNYHILRALFSKVAPNISPLFQVLGKALLTKRGMDGYARQSHASIADALANTVLQNLNPDGNATIDHLTYWTAMLETVRELLVNVSRHTERPYECITLVLQSFKKRDGFAKINRILKSFTAESGLSESNDSTEKLKFELARNGTRGILHLYLLLVTGKNVAEATQTAILTARADRDPTKPDYFNTAQVIVELRMAILPVIRQLWESDFVEKGMGQLSNKLIEIIRAVAAADHESGAHKRSDKISVSSPATAKRWKISTEHLQLLMAYPYPEDLVKEALFRCANSHVLAREYCQFHKDPENDTAGGRNPIPTEDVDSAPESSAASRAPLASSTGLSTPEATLMILDESESATEIPAQEMGPPPLPAHLASEPTTESYNTLLNGINRRLESAASTAPSSSGAASQTQPTPPSPNQQPLANTLSDQPIVTLDDLDAERQAIRNNLIDRCLDVINAHGDVTFEVADLITTVVNKSPDPSAMRKEMGETLVNALMSFAMEDDVRPLGKKIAAYAHLLALMLQDRPFYNACLDELKGSLEGLLGFIRLSPSHSPEEPSPWIAHVLLIVETLLSDDAQPRETKWASPKSETDTIETPVLMNDEKVVSPEARGILFTAILEIMPRVGKDESLALAVLRILVILTRDRPIAQLMGEKKNMQRLFVMAKQLAGVASVRLQNSLMIILRHIIEDDETIRQIMRSEIKSQFETNTRNRQNDIKSYLSTSAALIIRQPEIFVEVSNEMLKLSKWSPGSSDHPARHPVQLKEEFMSSRGGADASALILPAVQATEELSIDDIKPSTEELPVAAAPEKPKATELKTPVVENPDGVIHFLLSELLSYRDVDDREPTTPTIDKKPEIEAASSAADASDDSQMADLAQSAAHPAKDSKKLPKQEMKLEEHPIYVYRCFLLQCLTELLQSYNRTKIEFINFKRNSHMQANTPSKPRSSVVNYLLTELIPHGTLEHSESISARKKTTTSGWADSVLTALLSKTGEKIVDRHQDPMELDDEPDLYFVRKFVLENILKAYKEASQSSEPLDVKYSRILCLSDLMIHIMLGKFQQGGGGDQIVHRASSMQLRRIMYEKGYVAALTASIADIDLNFPQAKRAVKYILRPLKALTQTAIELSDEGKITTPPGPGDEDEIASATSVSDMEDEREETPDLFRNSALGMFEPGHDHESSSESEDEDEEMYDDGYDDEGMDYEEEMVDDDDEDNISDEDEEIEGMGDIEGLPGDHGVDVEVIMDDDGDEEEDSDDDDDSEDDDEDEDSDDMDDMDDVDHEHDVEIVDEEGNVLHGHEDDEDWQSEDEEYEEDYEARAADDEEAEMHGMNMGPGGPLDALARALGGGGEDGENAVEILQRIEDDMHNEEGGAFEIGQPPMDMDDMDDEEEDDDGEDMDEEDGVMYDDYPHPLPPMPAMPYDWASEDIGQPIIINHRGHQHRPRHGILNPFHFLPGDPRGQLGGTLDLSHRDSLNDAVAALDTALRDIRQSLQRIAPHDSGGRLDGLLGRFNALIDDSGRIHSSLERVADPPSGLVPDFGRNAGYRSHRPGQIHRGADEGTNPLLNRHAALGLGRDSSRTAMPSNPSPVAVMRPGDALLDMGNGRGPFGESPHALLNQVFNSLLIPPGSISRTGHALTFQVTGSPGSASRQFEALFGMAPRSGYDSRRRDNPYDPNTGGVGFIPQTTIVRWMDEAKMLFGSNHEEKARRVLTALMAVFVPGAIKASLEAKRIEEEARMKRDEEERIAREKKLAEEKAAKEKKEAEEAEERARQEADAAAAAAERGEGGDEDKSAEDMEGVESTEPAEASAPPTIEEAPAAPAQRVIVTIQGRQVDITELGIDPEFLEQIPEELRDEVIASAVQERRTQVAATGAQPSGIEQEFLDALPDEIREEIMQQERLDRRRRERDEARRHAAENGGGGPIVIPQDMDAASILATLDPALREQVLMEQEEDVLGLLPPEWAARASDQRRLQREMLRGQDRAGQGRYRLGDREDPASSKPVRRSIVQMLDKCGIATLLRLMFVYQHGSFKTTLLSVLQNVSENRLNRGEVISTLLHILQDGSADMTAIERSFAHLSLRAKQPKDKEKDPKTPQPLKRTLTGGTGINIVTSAEVSPLLVVQQCIATLVYLSTVNAHVPSFFLSEHEGPGNIKRSASRKGKGKDTKAPKYAINSLLGLLDRKLIMESASIMESLSDLLSKITSPLPNLDRKQKEIEAEEARKKEAGAKEATKVKDETSKEIGSGEAPIDDSTTEAATSAEPEAVSTGEDNTETTEASTSLVEPSDKAAPAKVSEPKKQRPFVPPVIPEANLKLVINIFVARECGNKTFRDTLSTVKNLSVIPGAKEVFGRELILKAQQLAEAILVDLDQLLPQIQKASTGTEIQGVALANFSPSGSDQNKLLRVLKALDHVFDSKPAKGIEVDLTAEAESSSTEKQDLLVSLYENPRFSPMWEKLSACLVAIRQRENMLNVATILLPLIESLMVVCKNTTLKDTSGKSLANSQMVLTSPPPESRMENLFFTFTEEHRKILNDLVRHSPKLMTGSFSLLVKNPKVLEFDNKRNYFNRSMHEKDRGARANYPPLQFTVKRDQVFHDSYRSLGFKKGDELKFGKLSIRFSGEEGVDAGGVTREWFQVLTRQMFDPGYALFIPVSSDRTTFHPNHLSHINPEHLSFFKFIGRIIGKALYESRVLDCHFSRVVYKSILGKAVSVKDMESLDPDYYKSIVWILENDITDVITETFSVDDDQFGVVNTVDLIENGRNIPVTDDNKQEYVRLMVEHKLTGAVKEQLSEFLKGFHEIIPAELISIFNEQELELLISGLPEIDVDDWKNNTELHQYTASSPQIQWFWRAIRSFDKEERAKMLQFVTGTSKVPLNGFKELEGMNGFSRFNIHRDYGSKDRLPTSHTCFNQLDLPEYENYETLRQQVLTAITAGSEYFGFA